MRFLIIVFLVLSFQGSAQDTVSVYFDFGSSKLSDQNSNLLGNLSDRFDLSEMDSVQIIGYADSVGKVAQNLRLSMRRAKTVEKACKFTLSEIGRVSLYARGEGTLEDPSLNRRVEVILFSNRFKLDGDTLDVVRTNANPKCFFIDLEALEYCHIRTVKKGRKESVFIEALNDSVIHSREHFYADKDRNGALTVRKVKWKAKETGMLWWKKTRLVTTISKDAFDKFQFFTMADDPCDGCKETVLTADTVIELKKIYYYDRFLADNMQYKIKFFGKDKVIIRAPRMYVDEMDTYYQTSYDWDIYNSNANLSDDSIVWETKRGKRKQDYLFAELPVRSNYPPIIIRARTTSICVDKKYGSGDDSRRWLGCMHFDEMEVEFQLNINAGAFYQNDSLTGFLAFGVSHTTENGFAQLMGGINTFGGFYGSASYQYHYMSFPFQALSFRNKWASTESSKPITKYGRLYLGTEIKASSTPDQISFFEGNAHLGLVFVNTEAGKFFPRIYLQGGVGHDFTGTIERNFYPIAQLGCTLNLAAFKREKKILEP